MQTVKYASLLAAISPCHAATFVDKPDSVVRVEISHDLEFELMRRKKPELVAGVRALRGELEGLAYPDDAIPQAIIKAAELIEFEERELALGTRQPATSRTGDPVAMDLTGRRQAAQKLRMLNAALDSLTSKIPTATQYQMVISLCSAEISKVAAIEAKSEEDDGFGFWLGSRHYRELSTKEFEHVRNFWTNLRDRMLAKGNATFPAIAAAAAHAVIGELKPPNSQPAPSASVDLQAENAALKAELAALKALRGL